MGQNTFTVLELYSGIGGMHYAFKRAFSDVRVASAFDINDIANTVYAKNFPDTRVTNRVIESLTINECSNLNADVWSMSPPCQPYTRLGKRLCESDNRSTSFAHVLKLLSIVRPNGVILENVKGFDDSLPCKQLLHTLTDLGYAFRHFLLTPLQFGIPNCRLRYYLVALKPSSRFTFKFSPLCDNSSDNEQVVRLTPPEDAPALPGCSCPVCVGETHHIKESDSHFSHYLPFCQPICNFLSTSPEVYKTFNFLDDRRLRKYFQVLDIVCPSDRKTHCFTKGYTKRLDGTGSLLQTCEKPQSFDEIELFRKSNMGDDEVLFSHAKSLSLRFFHSSEVSNFLHFPNDFGFPEHVTEAQRIRLLGNSVNILVLAHLMYWSFGDRC